MLSELLGPIKEKLVVVYPHTTTVFNVHLEQCNRVQTKDQNLKHYMKSFFDLADIKAHEIFDNFSATRSLNI